jgi:hypothetical protein
VDGIKIAERLGERTLFLKVNVASYKEQADAFSQTYKKWGRIDFGQLHRFMRSCEVLLTRTILSFRQRSIWSPTVLIG